MLSVGVRGTSWIWTFLSGEHAAGCTTTSNGFIHAAVVLGAQQTKNVNRWYIESLSENRGAALSFLEHNYPEDIRNSLMLRLVDDAWKRNVTICASCEPHIKDNVLTKLSAPIRLCDYAVDPVHIQKQSTQESQALPVFYERWQDH